MYESYLSLGGVEIANVDRLVGYARSADCAVSWLKTEGCGTLNAAMGESFPYTIENIDQAPWYDPSNADVSSRFYGIMVVDSKGLTDSSRQISLTEGILDGGTIGGRRRAAREARFQVLLVAQGKDALDYGISWLSSALDGDSCGQHGDVCGLVDLAFLVDCPPEVSEVYAGGTLIPDTPENIIEDLPDQVTDLEPIVNYAPPIEGSGNWAPAYENLFPNPRLKGDGTWVEVRRNYAKSPIANQYWETTLGLGGDGSILVEEVGGIPTRTMTWTEKPLHSNAHVVPGGDNSIPEGEYEASVRVAITGASDPLVYIRAAWYTESYDFVSDYTTPLISVSSDPSNPTTIVIPHSVTAGADLIRHIIHIPMDNIEVGMKMYVSSFMLGIGDYFDGSTTPETAEGIIQPEDFRWRWLGNPNASESVMEIEQVAGFSASNAIAGVSTREGKPAVRLIPTGESISSYVWSTVPIEARAGGTLLGTLHLDEPLTGSLSTYALSIRVQNPLQKESAPNTAGEHPLRLRFSELISSNTLTLYHGGVRGSGEVWLTDIGLFAGNYTGEAFNGESDPADTGIEQPEDFRIRWTGQPDESTSVMEIEQVETYAGSNAIAGMSTWEGRPAIRIIPTGSSNSSSAYAFFPISAPSVTAIGTVALNEQLQGEISPYALALETGGVLDSAPNLSGSHPLKISNATPYEGQVILSLSSGASQGNGDVWWTDIGLFAGEYDGPGFSEDTGWFQVEGNWYYATRGADGYISAMPGRMVSTFPTDDLKRFMHDVATSSGPLLIEELPTGNGKHHGAIMEFTVQSERGYIYTSPRNIDVTGAVLGSAADTEYNLMQNPGSVPDTGAAQHVVGKNLCPNPSLEVDATGWSGLSHTTQGRVVGELRAEGEASFKVTKTLTGGSDTVFLRAPRLQSIPSSELLGVDRATVGFWLAILGEFDTYNARVYEYGSYETIAEFDESTDISGGRYFLKRGVPLRKDSDGSVTLGTSVSITVTGQPGDEFIIYADACLYQVP